MDSKNVEVIEQCYRLLALCTRAAGHPVFYEQLAEQVKNFSAWGQLPEQAELHGMGPLLRYHLKKGGISIPVETMHILDGLYLRQRHINRIYTETLFELVGLFEPAGIKVQVLKGLALAYTCYPEPALRPVSDIDLLLTEEEVPLAVTILEHSGYRILNAVTTSKHQPNPVNITAPLREDITPSIELHYFDTRTKLPFYTPDLEMDGLGGEFVPIQIEQRTIYTPAIMNLYHYLWFHLQKHLLYIGASNQILSLKWIADIISITEQFAGEVDWKSFGQEHPDILRRLEIFYSLTPISEKNKEFIPILQISPLQGLNQYPAGWPGIIWRQRRVGFWRFLWQTFSPPSNWWLRLYYGIPERSVFWYGHVVHRLRIFSLMIWRLYINILARL